MRPVHARRDPAPRAVLRHLRHGTFELIDAEGTVVAISANLYRMRTVES